MKKQQSWMVSGLAVIILISLLTVYHNRGTPWDVPQQSTTTGSHSRPMILSSFSTGLGLTTAVPWLGTSHDPETGGNAPPDNQPPLVNLTNPADRSTVTRGTIVTINANAADNGQVAQMALYINGDAKIRQEGDSLTYTWDTQSAAPGEYTVKATAWDGEKAGESVLVLVVAGEMPIQIAENSQATVPEASRGQTQATRVVKTDTSKYPKLSPVRGSFGRFYYREASGGRIQVDPNWVAENIVTITLPGLNRQVQVHKNAASRFIKAFTYIKNGSVTINGRKVPLLSLIESMDGTYVTRHVNWNPSNGLSNHSWGAAIDINASDHFRYVNPGKEPYDPNLILWEKAFKPAGFSWGNSYADAMHFELLD